MLHVRLLSHDQLVCLCHDRIMIPICALLFWKLLSIFLAIIRFFVHTPKRSIESKSRHLLPNAFETLQSCLSQPPPHLAAILEVMSAWITEASSHNDSTNKAPRNTSPNEIKVDLPPARSVAQGNVFAVEFGSSPLRPGDHFSHHAYPNIHRCRSAVRIFVIRILPVRGGSRVPTQQNQYQA